MDLLVEGLILHVSRKNPLKEGMEQKHTIEYQKNVLKQGMKQKYTKVPNWKMSSAGGHIRESQDQRCVAKKNL